MRVVQQAGKRGSQKWLQEAVANRQDLLEPPALGAIEWRSPLADDDFAEYRDAAFLRRLGLEQLAEPLAAFWPARGPQWDALGRSERGPVLVEAKAHLAELVSPPCAAGPVSIQKIRTAFAMVQSDLGLPERDWTQTYYQYANRIAHLWWLRAQGIEAWLLLVGFLEDHVMNGPADACEWHGAYRSADRALGLPEAHALTPFILHREPRVSDILAR